jgi:hypothetical protein
MSRNCIGETAFEKERLKTYHAVIFSLKQLDTYCNHSLSTCALLNRVLNCVAVVPSASVPRRQSMELSYGAAHAETDDSGAKQKLSCDDSSHVSAT